MQQFLTKSISSLNKNKINGLKAEVDLRKYLFQIGFGDKISPGGWIARRDGSGEFGHRTVVFFPETIEANKDYSESQKLSEPALGLHTICATFHQTGIAAYFCSPKILKKNDPNSIVWYAKQLGLPTEQPYKEFPGCLSDDFRKRSRNYNFLRYESDVSSIPQNALQEEFSKESIRVSFQSLFMAEVSDVDGIFWGQQYTYPLEIKEKTAAENKKLGKFFGLDLGPFVKLAYYASKRSNLHSLFIVREIDSGEKRNLIDWWFITYEKLAQFASWVQQGGGTSMQGTQSSVVCIPKAEFSRLTTENLKKL